MPNNGSEGPGTNGTVDADDREFQELEREMLEVNQDYLAAVEEAGEWNHGPAASAGLLADETRYCCRAVTRSDLRIFAQGLGCSNGRRGGVQSIVLSGILRRRLASAGLSFVKVIVLCSCTVVIYVLILRKYDRASSTQPRYQSDCGAGYL